MATEKSSSSSGREGPRAAELVYDTTLRLPGEFFASGQHQAHILVGDYASSLRDIMKKRQPIPSQQRTERRTRVSSELESRSHVFPRNDAVRRPLQAPYDGPLKLPPPFRLDPADMRFIARRRIPKQRRLLPHATDSYHIRRGRRMKAPDRPDR
ncbi:hypothetical protein HPB49_006199 [Dermacentor silvarum]|uniref:Uncharacterized protein n=1 Tax=Dermacentor silvarum TaxID=543639 RepID=A0ACB8CDR3_DERSI|nr:hypothetical protein HPB49_006199 [Dermacentor silvarum]